MIFAPAQKVLQSFFPAALCVGVLEQRESVPAALQWERGGEGELRASGEGAGEFTLAFVFWGEVERPGGLAR